MCRLLSTALACEPRFIRPGYLPSSVPPPLRQNNGNRGSCPWLLALHVPPQPLLHDPLDFVPEARCLCASDPSTRALRIDPAPLLYAGLPQVGIAGLPRRLQDLLPEMDLGNQAHRMRFEDAIRGFQHGDGIDSAAMNRMYEAQTLWDEYMADSTSR